MSVALVDTSARLYVDPEADVPNDLVIEITLLTPTLAAEWLGLNMRNRHERPRKQSQYAEDMRAGAWMLTGQAIQFDWNGQLVDGQNRCRAVIASGVAVTVLVVRGLNPEVRGVIDTGVARTTADSIQILHGLPNAHYLAAIGRHAVGWDSGFTWTQNLKPSPTQIRNFVVEHVEELAHAVDVGRRCGRHLPWTATYFGFAYYACSTCQGADAAADADDFFDALATGENLSANDPRLVLRNRLIRDAPMGGPAADYDKTALTFRAWNAWRDGDEITKLQAPRGQGWTHKNFPRPY